MFLLKRKKIQEDPEYFIIGVEDGWIYVDNKTWQQYLQYKERFDNDLK